MGLESRTYQDFREDTLVYLSRRLNKGWNKPDWVSVNLTLKCNLSCSFCKTCYPVRQELTTREVKDIIDQTYLWGVKRFNPIGGEPFVRQDLEEILAYACAKDFYITLTTNGTLIPPKRAAKIAEIPYNRLHFNISLDGPNPWHDLGRGDGNFDKAVRGYWNLREADAAAGNPLRKISINAIINKLNLSELPGFLYWCRDQLGVQAVQFLNLFRHGNRIDPDVENMWITPDRYRELDDFVDFLIGFQEHEADDNFQLANSVGDLENIKKYYRDELKPLDGKCYSGWKELYVNADGSAIMCDGKLDFLNGSFGDIRRETLREMWNGPEVEKLRRNVKNCTTPCIQDCYLRRRSDSAVRIARGVSRLVFEELRKRYQTLNLEVPTFSDSVLTLQLSDTLDLETSWKSVPMERFRNLVKDSPEPWSAVREDPFRFYDFRNRGYLQFNRGYLAFDVIKSLVEDAQRNDTVWGTMRLAWEGEPLLHPQMEEILAWLAEAWESKPFARRIEIPTNATLLNHNYCRITADHGSVPFTWVFEVAAYDTDSYQKSHGEPLWDRVLDNLNFLLQEIQEKDPRQLRVIVQCTVTPETEELVEGFRDFWLAHLESYGLEAKIAAQGLPSGEGHWLHFRRMDPPDLEGIRAARSTYAAALNRLGIDPAEGAPDESSRRVCASYWKTPTVSWDGKVLLCPVDVQQNMKVGDVTHDSLSDTWWKGTRLHQIRSQAVKEDFSGLNLCRGCNHPYSPNAATIEADEIERALQSMK
ncbi:MAG: radical SAM protein [Myxococcota bacterium]|nr:radical SAM protein [Myxococcota bacterium]